MIEAESKVKIEFSHFTLQDKALYERFLGEEGERGCEFSFANLYLWGRQSFAVVEGQLAMFSQFNRRTVYPYPLGRGDKRAVLDRIMADAAERGIPCRLTGLSEEDKATVEALYPGRFRFHNDAGAYDYVYASEDLAELKGKKYHGKRNHLHRFKEAFPNYTVQPLEDSNIKQVKQMVAEWYRVRLEENPNSDYLMEQAALEKAFRDYRELELDGLVLLNGEEVLAVTLASRLSEDTMDVHFEKARPDVNGAYTAINCEFARYIRNKYPKVLFLNREEDMGLEGLRRAKQSYRPHHMVKKCWACLLEDGYDY